MQNALITGTSTGLGRGIAQSLHERGWDVIGTIRQESHGVGVPWTCVLADITSPTDLARIDQVVKNRWGKLDALINNAGICQVGPWEELSSDEITHQLNVNVIGAMNLVRQSLSMLRKGAGVIVQISSDSGQIAEAMFGAYNASKFALEGASEALQEEVASDGVRVVVIEPGNFRTEIARHSPQAKDKNSTQKYIAQWNKIDEWLTWHGNKSPNPDKCVEAIVAAVTNLNTPFRLAIGEGVSDSIRQRAKQIISQMDASDNFLNSL
ncbi:short-chain dehydrogenase/reductase [Actinomycetes bacterium]|nr:short-chain dehydrogenase/reductase [Actinomycetes bacterium]